jgi:predicted peptidase
MIMCRSKSSASFFSAVLLVAFGTSAFCFGLDVKYSTGNLSYSDGQGHSMPYRLYLPPDYNAPGKQFPLITLLHGSGESGTDNVNPSYWIDEMYNFAQGNKGAQYEAFILVPQTQWGWQDYGSEYPEYSYGQILALDIIDLISSTYQVDTRRLYLTGLSMGGYGTFNAIQNHPDKFAAAAPLSGGGDPSMASLIKDIPIWAFHGSSDTVVPVTYTDAMFDAIENAGGSIEYTRVDGLGHGGWETFWDGKTYRNSKGETFYQWLFSKSLPVPEPSSMTLLGVAGLGLFYGIRRRFFR